MNFIDAVNRTLRIEGVIAGDDDNIASFSETQHENMINLAKIAVQDELNDFVSDKVLPYEHADGYITLVEGTRTYSLANDFIRMRDENWFLEEVSAATSTGTATGVRIYPWPGGEENLRKFHPQYRTTKGSPNYCYFSGGTSHQIGFFQVPNSNANGKFYRYEYEKNVAVSAESDVIPLINNQAAQSFVEACAIHFKYLRVDPEVRTLLFPNGLYEDRGLQQARGKVLEFVSKERPKENYGRRYC